MGGEMSEVLMGAIIGGAVGLAGFITGTLVTAWILTR